MLWPKTACLLWTPLPREPWNCTGSSGEAVSPSPEGSVAQLERPSEGNILAQVLSFFACKVKGSPGSPQHLRLHSRSEPARWRRRQSVQLLSRVQLFATSWLTACQASLSITNSQSLLKLTSIKSVMPSNHLILCHPLLLLPSILPSIRVFSNESVLHIRWPKVWSLSFSFSLSNEYPGLISFRIDWFDLLAVQGNFKSLLQHHSSKASILRGSAYFMVQLSHP